MDDAHLKILQMIQDGIISADEAEELLHALESDDSASAEPEAAEATGQTLTTAAESARTGPPAWWERVWVYVLGAGVLLAALAVAFTIPIAQARSHPGWLACTLPLLFFGLLLTGLTWWSRTARWLHVRVREEEQRIDISLPLPLKLAAWGLRLARPWVPKLKGTGVDEAILALADVDTGGEEILVVEVDDTESGEQVEVRIG